MPLYDSDNDKPILNFYIHLLISPFSGFNYHYFRTILFMIYLIIILSPQVKL